MCNIMTLYPTPEKIKTIHKCAIVCLNPPPLPPPPKLGERWGLVGDLSMVFSPRGGVIASDCHLSPTFAPGGGGGGNN